MKTFIYTADETGLKVDESATVHRFPAIDDNNAWEIVDEQIRNGKWGEGGELTVVILRPSHSSQKIFPKPALQRVEIPASFPRVPGVLLP